MLRRCERITDTDRKQTKKDYLLKELFDCRIGSERWIKIENELDELDRLDNTSQSTFDPDKRI